MSSPSYYEGHLVAENEEEEEEEEVDEVEECSVALPSLVQEHHVNAWNEMLNAENASLRERVYELERKVHAQEDELVCLRSSTADLVRRLTILEQSSCGQSGQQSRAHSSNSPDVFTRLSSPHHSAERSRLCPSRGFSQSTYNLRSSPKYPSPLTNGHRPMSPSPIRRTSLDKDEPNGFHNEPQRFGSAPRRSALRNGGLKANNVLNSSVGRIMPSAPIRKWMSSADVVKETNNNTNANTSNSNLASPITSPTVGPTGSLLRNAKSTTRLGSLSSLAASHRSLSQIGCSIREPVFLTEQRMLQVFIRGKSVLLPPPSSITHVDPLRELDPPRKNVQLEWVYGYRGKDCRGNLHSLPTGEMVYFTGAVVVLHNVDEGTQRHYTQHTSEIKCIAIHPNKLHIATGQTSRHSPEKKILNEHRSPICSSADLDSVLEADQTQAHVRIWDSVTLQTLRTLGVNDSSFKRGVSCVAFSHQDGGALLAAIDDSYEHTLSVWDWQRRKKITETKSANDQVFDCEFHPLIKNLLVSFGKGHFNFWHFDGVTLSKKIAVFEGRDKPKVVLSICFTENGSLVTGDSNGTISLWDPRTFKVIKQAFKIHEGGVWALCSIGGVRLISGGKDRSLIEWNASDLVRIRGPIMLNDDAGTIRTVAPAAGSMILVGTTKNAILVGDMKGGFRYVLQGHSDELWALSIHPCMSQYLTGSIDGTLRFWDSISRSLVWSMQIDVGISCVDFHPGGNMFAIGTAAGSWVVYDSTLRALKFTATEGTSPISTLRFSPDGKLLAVATKESLFYLYSVAENLYRFARVLQFHGVNSFITTIDWSSDSTLLRTNSNDLEHHIWTVSNGRAAETSAVRDATWTSSRCPVSFENGCLTHSLPGIMAIERSADSQFVAVALDNGAIRFYRHPTTTIMASHKEIFGHSSFIGNVAFLQTRLISVGAKDSAIFQWTL